MKLRRAPIQDLLSFLEEEGDTFTKWEDILKCVSQHYKSLTNCEINFRSEAVLEDLCFCDNGIIANNTLPLKNGILVWNGKEYGIIFRNYFSRGLEHSQVEDFWVWKINKNGMLDMVIFNVREWTHWGAMTSFYEYDDYEEGLYAIPGRRDVKIGMTGRDVLALQGWLANMGEANPITGYFSEDTKKALTNVQAALSKPRTGVFTKEDFGKYIR